MYNHAACLFTNVHVGSLKLLQNFHVVQTYTCVCVCNAVSVNREHRREGTKGNPMLYSRVYTL